MITIERQDGNQVCGRISLPEGVALWTAVIGDWAHDLEFFSPWARATRLDRKTRQEIDRRKVELTNRVLRAVAKTYPHLFGRDHAAF